MIEIWKCNNCGFEAVDMAFYKPGLTVGICPKCGSNNIIVGEQGWIGAPDPDAKEETGK